MRYDDEASALIIDDDFALPAKFFITETYEYQGDYFAGQTQETRVFRCEFENRWALSIIWGSMTYSTNKDHPHGNWRGTPAEPFVEEPNTVEVGIIMPETRVRPKQVLDVEGLPNWSGPTEIPEQEYELWGDPMGWVDAAGLRALVGLVSRFDSHTWVEPTEGPYLEQDDDGRYYLRINDPNEREEADEESLEVHPEPGRSAEDRRG
jgi:hypothetical protein